MTTEVRVPTLGESVTEATIATWFKKPGDAVAVDEMICELETDKVTVEVPSPVAGQLAEIIAAEGQTVEVGALLATIADAAADAPAQQPDRDAAKAAQPAPAAAAPSSERENLTAVTVPALGESVTEATVANWFKKVGDDVKQDEMLCELETDKVSLEIPAPAGGVLREISAAKGATVAPGDRIATISGSADGMVEPALRPQENAPDDAAGIGAASASRTTEDSPAARKAMAEAGIPRDSVTGSGRDGRIMKEDVARSAPEPASSAAPAQAPTVPPRSPSPVEDATREERVPMTRLRQTIARRLKDAQNTAAILTTYNEVDMSAVMDLREQYKTLFERKHGVRLGFMSFFTKACCHALNEVPEVNAELDGTDVIYKNFVHMGIATGTPSGLVVPVIRDADSMSFAEIEKAIAEKSLRARDGKLTIDELQGGTFTISNGGVYGSLMSSPILNPPQSGILGMHKIEQRPVVVGGEIVIRPMMYLALSYDHRIVDGKGAVTFLVRVKEALEDPRRLLMDL